MKKTQKFKIVNGNCTRTIASGFISRKAAQNWILMRDYGQFEDEGGWFIIPYLG